MLTVLGWDYAFHAMFARLNLTTSALVLLVSQSYCHYLEKKTEQEGQRCPKRRVAQAAIRLATAVITFRNKERNVRSPS